MVKEDEDATTRTENLDFNISNIRKEGVSQRFVHGYSFLGRKPKEAR
jgi:hypothetical protein